MPRVVAQVRTGEVDPGLALRAFGPHYADQASWPADERQATEDALTAVLAYALENWRSHDLVGLLGGLASIADDLTPWLARLDPDTGPAARGGVVRLAFYWATDLLWGEDKWFAWWYPDDQVTPVREWTLGVRPVVERFSQDHPTCRTARDALIAYDRLDRDEPSPWVVPGYADHWWSKWGLPGGYGWLIPVGR